METNRVNQLKPTITAAAVGTTAWKWLVSNYGEAYCSSHGTTFYFVAKLQLD